MEKNEKRVSSRHGVGRGEGGEGGGTQFGHGRSRMTIDHRTPAMPGRSTSNFHRPGRHRAHPAHNAARCSGSRMKGELRGGLNR